MPDSFYGGKAVCDLAPNTLQVDLLPLASLGIEQLALPEDLLVRTGQAEHEEQRDDVGRNLCRADWTCEDPPDFLLGFRPTLRAGISPSDVAEEVNQIASFGRD